VSAITIAKNTKDVLIIMIRSGNGSRRDVKHLSRIDTSIEVDYFRTEAFSPMYFGNSSRVCRKFIVCVNNKKMP
jgi:hypothetical protein